MGQKGLEVLQIKEPPLDFLRAFHWLDRMILRSLVQPVPQGVPSIQSLTEVSHDHM